MLTKTSSTRQKGFEGELRVSEFLSKKKCFSIIEKNYYSRYGEIDLVCKDGKHLVFVEVRSFSNPRFNPIETLTQRKIKHIKLAATLYLQQLEAGFIDRHQIEHIRFDFVAFDPAIQTFVHTKNIF